MKIADVDKFKGVVKTALRDWGRAKIDELLPKKTVVRTLLKNGLDNILARYEADMDRWADSVFLFMADGKGAVDSDGMIDTFAAMLGEMRRKEYVWGAFAVTAGGGEIEVCLPQNFLMDMLVGDMGAVRITADDIKEIKNMIV